MKKANMKKVNSYRKLRLESLEERALMAVVGGIESLTCTHKSGHLNSHGHNHYNPSLIRSQWFAKYSSSTSRGVL